MKKTFLSQSFRKITRILISISIFILIIYILKKAKWDIIVSFEYIPSFKTLVNEIFLNITQGDFYMNIIISISRVITGYILAVLLAIPLAILIVENKKIEFILVPITELIRPIPNVAWVPLTIVLFKTISGSIIFITFIGAFFPILINTIEGLRKVNNNYLKIAKSFKLERLDVILKVKLPAATHSIYVGLLVGMSGSWLGVIVAEMLSGKSGVGYITWVNYTMVNLPGVIVGMLIIGFLGTFFSELIRFIYKKSHLGEVTNNE